MHGSAIAEAIPVECLVECVVGCLERRPAAATVESRCPQQPGAVVSAGITMMTTMLMVCATARRWPRRRLRLAIAEVAACLTVPADTVAEESGSVMTYCLRLVNKAASQAATAGSSCRAMCRTWLACTYPFLDEHRNDMSGGPVHAAGMPSEAAFRCEPGQRLGPTAEQAENVLGMHIFLGGCVLDRAR